MYVNRNAGLSQAQAKNNAVNTATNPQQQQSEFVGSKASLASRAYATAQIHNAKNINFEGKYEKLTEAIKTTTNPSKIHINFEEAVAIFEKMGYKVKQGKGSHCTVDVGTERPLTVVRPHGHHDYIHPETIKEIKNLINKQAA